MAAHSSAARQCRVSLLRWPAYTDSVKTANAAEVNLSRRRWSALLPCASQSHWLVLECALLPLRQLAIQSRPFLSLVPVLSATPFATWTSNAPWLSLPAEPHQAICIHCTAKQEQNFSTTTVKSSIGALLGRTHQTDTAMQGLIVLWQEVDVRKAPTASSATVQLIRYQVQGRKRAEGGKSAGKLLGRHVCWESAHKQTNGQLLFSHTSLLAAAGVVGKGFMLRNGVQALR